MIEPRSKYSSAI